jgi:hypothetical protein
LKVFFIHFAPLVPNGPAIWGGCVTRHKHRAGSRYPEYSGPESCHGARRVWRTFCRHGTNFIEHYECRGTNLIGAANLSPVTKFGCVHWRSVAIQIVSEPEIRHGTGFILRADARVWVQRPLRICLECRSKSKKCDKQLTHIVRVSGAFFR